MTDMKKTQLQDAAVGVDATQDTGGCACGGDGGCGGGGEANTTEPTVISIDELKHPEPVQANEGDLDVRTIDRSVRHARVIGVVTSLVPGESMVIAADHAPRGVIREIEMDVTGDFKFDYLAEGPSLWRLQVERVTCC